MIPNQNPDWREVEKTWAEEWKTALEIWEQTDQEAADFQLGAMVADLHFSNDSAASNKDPESIRNDAVHHSGQPETAQRTLPMSPQMIAVETATRELLKIEEQTDLLKLSPALQDSLQRRSSIVEMQTVDAPRYVKLPIRERKIGPAPSRSA
jgi:hypothetical protein